MIVFINYLRGLSFRQPLFSLVFEFRESGRSKDVYSNEIGRKHKGRGIRKKFLYFGF